MVKTGELCRYRLVIWSNFFDLVGFVRFLDAILQGLYNKRVTFDCPIKGTSSFRMAQPKIKTVLSVTIFSGRFSLLTPVIAKTAGSISYILSEYLRQTSRLQGLSPTLPWDELDYRQRIVLPCATCKTVFTSGEGEVKDSRRSGTY